MQRPLIRLRLLEGSMIRLVGNLLILALLACAIAGAQTADKPVIMSERAIREAARSHVEPEYPATARQFRVSGQVIADLTVGIDGKVESVAILKGNALLNAAVIAALKKWTFPPFTVDGHPAKVKSTMTFVFAL
jgi:TonB family protein